MIASNNVKSVELSREPVADPGEEEIAVSLPWFFQYQISVAKHNPYGYVMYRARMVTDWMGPFSSEEEAEDAANGYNPRRALKDGWKYEGSRFCVSNAPDS